MRVCVPQLVCLPIIPSHTGNSSFPHPRISVNPISSPAHFPWPSLTILSRPLISATLTSSPFIFQCIINSSPLTLTFTDPMTFHDPATFPAALQVCCKCWSAPHRNVSDAGSVQWVSVSKAMSSGCLSPRQCPVGVSKPVSSGCLSPRQCPVGVCLQGSVQ